MLAEALTGDAQQQRYEMFFRLLLDRLARLIRASAAGQGSADEMTLAARMIPPARQPAWAELWQTILRDKADAEELNLDRKALIVRTFARIEAASRR
jgi:DNA polymerase-3 subunit delta'